jgi:hypothetical protein
MSTCDWRLPSEFCEFVFGRPRLYARRLLCEARRFWREPPCWKVGRTNDLDGFLYLGRVIFGAKWRAVDVCLLRKQAGYCTATTHPYPRGFGDCFDFLLLVLLLQSSAC